MKRKQLRVNEFLEKLESYVKSVGEDTETYYWLIRESPGLQHDLGSLGVAINYRPPYSNYIVKYYEIVINDLPVIRQCLNGQSTKLLGYELSESLKEAVVRYDGTLDEKLAQVQNELRNPVIWLREGVRQILLLPVKVLEWVGLASPATVSKIAGKAIFTTISGIIAVIGLISGVMTIILEWTRFAQELNRLIK